MSKAAVAVGLVAGLLGGLLGRYLAPPPAFAQNQTPVTKEIRAQSFTFVDQANRSVGTLTVEAVLPLSGAKSSPQFPDQGSSGTRIVLRDASGREIWSAGDTGQVRKLSQR